MQLKVLLIDRNPGRAALLSRALREAGHDVVCETDSVSGLEERVEAARPDLIIVDVESPDRDIVENMGKVSLQQSKPLVMFAARSDSETLRRAVRAGVSAYVVGDTNLERLAPIIEIAIARFGEYRSLREEIDDTRSRLADVLLPALAWGEKTGLVTNSERRVSAQRRFLPVPGDARPDWRIVCDLAARLGYGEHFAYRDGAEIIAEHARLAALGAPGGRLDLSALADFTAADYAGWRPRQWPMTGTGGGAARLFGNGGFCTPSGRARMLAVEPAAPRRAAGGDYPLVLNTGRYRDQWHSMTRSGRSPRLTAHRPEPAVELSPGDAAVLGLAEGGLARLDSPQGRMLARVRLDPGQRPGSVFVPIHWSDATATQSKVDDLVAAETDPLSGQPESKHGVAAVRPWSPRWQGLVLSRRALDLSAPYRVRVRAADCWRTEIAGEEPLERLVPALLAELGGDRRGEWIEFRDPAAGRYRAALVADGALQACLFLDARGALPQREWLQGLFARPALPEEERRALLSGRAREPAADPGRTVCARFGVGENTLARTIRERGLVDLDGIAGCLRAGTGCGSCIAELRALLHRHQLPRSA